MIIHFVCLYLPDKFCSGCPPDWHKDVYITFPSLSVVGILMGVMKQNFTSFYKWYYAFPSLLI